MSDGTILGEVRRYYAGRLQEHGATPRGVDWNGAESQALRHAQFLRLLGGSPDASVLDLGCGYGDFLPFLRAQGHRGAFAGWDVVPEMVAAARAAHAGDAAASWHVGSVPEAPADFAIASGVLNVKGERDDGDWAAYAEGVVAVLAAAGRRGFGFNMLSLCSDPPFRRPHLHYADPAAVLRRCLDRYGRHVALLQDYGLWEFTVLVRHG